MEVRRTLQTKGKQEAIGQQVTLSRIRRCAEQYTKYMDKVGLVNTYYLHNGRWLKQSHPNKSLDTIGHSCRRNRK